MIQRFSFFEKYRSVLLYGIAMALLLLLLKWLEWKFLLVSHRIEIYIGFIALVFTGLGVWLALKLTKPKIKEIVIEKEVVVEKQIHVPAEKDFVMNEETAGKLGISKRELEVLQLMAKGLSNNEIAAQLFVSLNTVKTHSSNLFVKLDAKRRTQAIEKAKHLRIIP
jgi:two-component system, NarL family, response regulator LiaR